MMKMPDKELEPDENVIARISEVLAHAQSGALVGMVCICFMRNDSVNVQVSGEQSLIVRLGALSVAADAMKVFETQKKVAAQQAAQWGPGGTAAN